MTFAALVACGGQSIRYTDEGAGGEPDEPSRGGAPNGGKGGKGGKGGSGAVGPAGGSAPFTGGTSSGGSIGVGGTGAIGTGGSVATGGTGGSVGIGGSGAFGTGGAVGGCGAVDPFPDPPSLSFGDDGLVYSGSNPYGISGGWYSFDDCSSAMSVGLACTARDPSLRGPDGLSGWVTQADRACASGTAPRVELGPDGTPAYSFQWGFGLGLNLNQSAPWDAASRCIRGFVVEILGSAPAMLRVNVVTPQTNGVSHFVETPLGGNVIVDFATIRQGPWVANPTPLDTSMITDLQFHVFTNEQTSVPYHFCVSNIRPLY